MQNTIRCLQAQTFHDFEVIFIVDKHLTEVGEFIHDDPRLSFITNLNSSFRSKRDANDPVIGGNASQLRNYGIKEARGEFVLLMDDDEWFPDDYLEKYFYYRDLYRKRIGKDFVLCPTLMYRKTGTVQNYGFSHYDYWMSRPVLATMGNKEWISVQMYS
jgi:glycosyltransferase involved in cell wall biosynthesis